MGSWAPPRHAAVGCAAGCASGLAADVLTHPLSTVKTRLQVQGSGGGLCGVVAYRGTLHALWSVARTEGPLGLYRGLGAVLVGAAPAQGLFFGTFESIKAVAGPGAAGSFAAGACANLAGALVWVPLDVVKQRLQLGRQVQTKQAFSGSFEAFRGILRQEGPRGVYRGFLVNQATWAPFNGCYFLIYEKCKGLCIEAGYEDGHDNLTPMAQLCCGASAGVVAAVLSNPLDVLKTRVQVARANPDMFPFSGALSAARHLLRHEGPRALLDGAAARAAWLTPRLTLVVASYEHVRAWLTS